MVTDASGYQQERRVGQANNSTLRGLFQIQSDQTSDQKIKIDRLRRPTMCAGGSAFAKARIPIWLNPSIAELPQAKFYQSEFDPPYGAASMLSAM